MSAVTVSMMFSDLVGSTETLVRVGEVRMEALRRDLFGVLRAATADHHGDEVKSLGDGLMFVFPSASDLVEAAVAVQRCLDSRNSTAAEPLAVRIGLATGDADAVDDDYFGVAVVEAARLCAAAEGGQILATETVHLLSRQRTDHEFVSLGAARAYKGFDRPIPVCEVIWEPAPPEMVPLPMRLERPPGATFVGRAEELAGLLEALKAASASGGRHVLVSGEAGIGKTALLADFARTAHEQGSSVLYGRCDEDVSIPYEPWREVVAHLDNFLPSAVDENRDELSILLSGAESQSSGMDADAARYVLHNAVVETLARASSSAPVVVVLEDLHWADAPTIALARHVAQSTAEHPAMLVATFREAELDTAHPLTATLAALHREQSVERLALRGLNDLEVLALLEALAGHEMDRDGLALRDALRAETDGNPFFTTEILRHLAETGAITQRDGRWAATTDLLSHGLPVSVREVIGLRVARLGDGTRHLLRYAAVIGRDFDLPLLADLVGMEDDSVHSLLVPAVESAVLEDVAPNQFSFSHALIGHALYDELTTTAIGAHRVLGEALERQVGEGAEPRAADLAHRRELATPLSDVPLTAMAV